MRFRNLSTGSVVCLALAAACDADTTVTSAFAPVPSASTPAPYGALESAGGITMFVGDTFQVKLSGATAKERVIKWTSSNSAVARVNSAGLVEGVAAGSATVSAKGLRSSTSVAFSVVKAVSLTMVAPKTTFLLGEQGDLSVLVRTSDGKDVATRQATWAATGSTFTVNTTGMVTAVAPGTGSVSATIGSLRTSVELTSTPPGVDPTTPILTGFSIAPKSVAVAVGASQQFTTTTTWSDGLARQQAVTYTATGGTISPSGLFQAGQTAGAAMVIATCACGRVDTANVVVSANVVPTLTAMQLSPRTVSLAPGATQQFVISVQWSDGQSRATSFSFSVVGSGTVNSGGLYTAPSTGGSYKVIASQVGGTLKDTATITVVDTSGVPSSTVVAELPRAYLDTMVAGARNVGAVRTIAANSAAAFQAALDTSRYGDVIVLQPGATYSSSFYLRKKTGTGWITIRSASPSLPAAGIRARPSDAGLMPKLVSPISTEPVIVTEPGAHNYRLVGLEVTATSAATLAYSLVTIHPYNVTTAAVSDMPYSIVLDRMYIHGTPTLNFQRCVVANGLAIAVVDSWISECHGIGMDSQAIFSYNGSGPYKYENNYLEGAGENIMIGGADPQSSSFIPSDIEIKGNHIAKPAGWQGGPWSIKNLFELKVGIRVLLDGNVLENNWVAGQQGFAIGLKSSNQTGPATWSETRDVTLRYNIIRNVANGISAAGSPDPYPTVKMSRVNVFSNSFEKIGSGAYPGGMMLQIAEVADFIFESNSGVGTMRGLGMGSTGLARFRFVDNVFGIASQQGGTWDYGVYSFDGLGFGLAALNAHTTNWTFSFNLLPGDRMNPFPTGNSYPSDPSTVGFLSWPSNLELSSTSAYRNASSRGGAPGADFPAIRLRTAGVVVSP